MFKRPEPCSRLLTLRSGCAENIRTDLTKFGVIVGFVSSTIAAAPETRAAAIEVPLRYIICFAACGALPGFNEGFSRNRLFCCDWGTGEHAPNSLFPGATRSGFIRLS